MDEQKDFDPATILRVTAITLTSLAVAVTLLGGAGTICVAFNAEKYVSMLPLVPYKPLYQWLVFVSLGAGAWGIPVTIALNRGRHGSYRNALIMLTIGALAAGIQMAVSQSLRGASDPVNMRFYVTLLALLTLGLLRLPPAWAHAGFSQTMQSGNSKAASAGTALFLCGILVLTSRLWTSATHVSPAGENWIAQAQGPLHVLGLGLAGAGAALLFARLRQLRKKREAARAINRPFQESSHP